LKDLEITTKIFKAMKQKKDITKNKMLKKTRSEISNFIKRHKDIIVILLVIIEFYLLNFLVECRFLSVLLLWISLGILFLFIIDYQIKLKNKNNDPNILIQIILNLKGEAGNWFGIFSILYVLINLNWLSTLTWNVSFITKGEELNFFSSFYLNRIDYFTLNSFGLFFVKLLLILEFLFLPFILFPGQKKQNPTDPKVLIAGVSLLVPRYNKIDSKELKSALDRFNTKNEEQPFDYFNIEADHWGRWNSINKSLFNRKSIEQVVLLVSHDVIALNEEIIKLGKAYQDKFNLEKLIYDRYPDRNIKIIKSCEIDFNTFLDAKTKIEEVLQRYVLPKYKDEEILFNITGGTAPLSTAMILHALKGERKAEYVHQKDLNIIDIDVDVLTVQDLWDEILQKVQEKSIKK
jgi:hypothetical protein